MLSAVNQSAKTDDLIAFLHGSLFSPSLSTVGIALGKEHTKTFPSLLLKSMREHPPMSKATIKSHLDQERKNKQSTNKNRPPLPPPVDKLDQTNDECEDQVPEPLEHRVKTHCCFAATEDIKPGQTHLDPTGKFTVPPNSGNTKLFALHDCHRNCMFADPMKSKSAKCMLEACKKTYNRRKAAGGKPKLQKVNDKCSDALKQCLNEEDVNHQLAPPCMH